MRLARVVRYSFFGILALLAVVIVLLLTVDLGRFKGTTENLLSDLLGREFTINGEFQVQLGRHIHVVAEDVRLSNADWGADEVFASVGRFEGTVDTWSLFSFPISIESLHIENARVHLESTDSGENNWALFPPKAPDEEINTQAEGRPSLPVMVTDASIKNLELTYNNPRRLRPLLLAMTEIKLTQTDADKLHLGVHGHVNETPLELSANAGTIDNLVNYLDVEFDVSGHLGEIRFDGDASIDDLLQPRRPTARLKLQGPNAEYLTDTLRLREVTTGPLDLTATIAPVGEKMQLLLNGVFGEFSLDLTGGFVDLQGLQDVDLRIAASGPDAGTVASLFGNDTVPADPFNIVGNLQRSGSMIALDDIKVTIGKSQFDIGGRFDDFPDPRSARATIHIDGPDFGRFNKLLGLPGRLTGPFTLSGDLAPLAEGGASVDLTAVAQDVQVNLVGSITDNPDFVGTRVEVTAAGPNLQVVTTAGGLTNAPAEPFEFKVHVERIAKGAAIETATLAIADDHLSLRGLVGNKPLDADTDIQFEVSGPDLAKTLTAFGRDADELPTAQYKVSGRIERDTEFFVLHEIAAAIGNELEYQLTADGQLSLRPNFEGSSVRLSATGTSLGALTDAAGIEGIPDQPFAVGATIERVANGFSVQGGSVHFGDDRINLQGLIGDKPLERDTNVRFDVRAPNLKATLQSFGFDLEALPVGEFDVAGEVRHQGSHFAVPNLTASLAGASVTLGGRLGAFPELEGTRLTVKVDGADLSRLLPDEPRFSALNKPYGLATNLTLRDQELSLADIEVSVGRTRLTGNVDLGLSPLLDSGRFSIDATAPDLYKFTPELTEIPVGEEAPLELHTTGNWADNLWTLDEFYLQIGKGNLTANGTFDGPPDFDRTDLRLDLSVSSLRNLSRLAGQELPDDPAHLSFHLVGTDDTVSMDEFKGTFGDSDITGEFSLRYGDVPEIKVSFRSDRLNLAPYLTDATEEVEPPVEPTAATTKNDRVIPDTVIPVEELREYAASVDIQVAELVMPRRTWSDLVLIGAIESGALLVKEFNFGSDQGETLTGEFELRPSDSGAELLLAVQGSALKVGLPVLTDEEFLALPSYDVETILHGSGTTLRELAGSLNGYVRVLMGQGKIRPGALKFFTGDFLSQVLDVVNPFAKTDPYSSFECGAVLLRIDDGILTGRPGVVTQSDRLRIFANTILDLNTEKIDVTINTVPQKGLGISFSNLINPYTKLGGTLANPSLTLDPEGVVLEGGAAIATGGISILAKGFKDRFLSAKDPCAKALKDSDSDLQAIKDLYYPEFATGQ